METISGSHWPKKTGQVYSKTRQKRSFRFGDPQAQVVLPLLESDLGLTLHRLSMGEITQLKWRHDLHAVGLGSTATEATNNAYSQASQVQWQNLVGRDDIGLICS